MRTHKRMKFIPLILTCLVTACVSNGDQKDKLAAYRKDAERFCEVFSIESWNDMKKGGRQGVKLQNEFLRRVDAAVETKEFEAIMDGQHKQPKNAAALYQYYVTEVSKITGQKYQCDHIKVYFEETLRFR